MATVGAKAKRRAIVQQRLADSMAALAETLGIDVPAESQSVRDTELAAIIDLERQATMLDAILAAIPDDLNLGPESGETELLDMTRKEIVAIATDLGIEAPDKIKGGKPAIEAAIEAKRAELAAAAETETPTDSNADPSTSEDSGTDGEGNDDPNADDGNQDGA